jgi:hypothetical protein
MIGRHVDSITMDRTARAIISVGSPARDVVADCASPERRAVGRQRNRTESIMTIQSSSSAFQWNYHFHSMTHILSLSHEEAQ